MISTFYLQGDRLRVTLLLLVFLDLGVGRAVGAAASGSRMIGIGRVETPLLRRSTSISLSILIALQTGREERKRRRKEEEERGRGGNRRKEEEEEIGRGGGEKKRWKREEKGEERKEKEEEEGMTSRTFTSTFTST